MNKLLRLLDEAYDNLAKLVLFADGSGHIVNEALEGGAGERVFDFENLAQLKRHLTKRTLDGRVLATLLDSAEEPARQ